MSDELQGFDLSGVPKERLLLEPPLEHVWSFEGGFRTPLVREGRIFSLFRAPGPDGAIRRRTVCLDESGKVRWEVGEMLSEGWGIAGRRLIGVSEPWWEDEAAEKELVIVDLDAGTVVHKEQTSFGICAVLPGLEFIGRAAADKNGNGRVVRVARVHGVPGQPVVWEKVVETRGGQLGFDPYVAIDGGRLFVGRNDELVCLDLETGQTIWETSLERVGGGVSVGKWKPKVSRGRVVIGVGHGIAAFDTETGELVWFFQRHGVDAIYDDRVYLLINKLYGSDPGGGYFVLDLTSGELVTQTSLDELAKMNPRFKKMHFSSWPLVTETHVFFGDHAGRLWALERETGRPVWHHRNKEGLSYWAAVPVPSGKRIYITSFNMDPEYPTYLHCYEQA